METQSKSFDAVRCMREIREALSREFQGMSFEEQQLYIREQVHIYAPEGPSGRYAAQPSYMDSSRKSCGCRGAAEGAEGIGCSHISGLVRWSVCAPGRPGMRAPGANRMP